MKRRLVSTFLILSLAACGNGESDAASTASTTPPTQVPSTTNPGESGYIATTPETAAEGLFAAVNEKDREEAERYAPTDVVDDLFDSKQPLEWEFVGCRDDDDNGENKVCDFRYEGGGTQMSVEEYPNGTFAVIAVIDTAD